MKEHMVLQVGDTIKIEGQEGIWKVTETPSMGNMEFNAQNVMRLLRLSNASPVYIAIREGHGVIRTYREFDQQEADTKVKKLVEGPE